MNLVSCPVLCTASCWKWKRSSNWCRIVLAAQRHRKKSHWGLKVACYAQSLSACLGPTSWTMPWGAWTSSTKKLENTLRGKRISYMFIHVYLINTSTSAYNRSINVHCVCLGFGHKQQLVLVLVLSRWLLPPHKGDQWDTATTLPSENQDMCGAYALIYESIVTQL